MSPRQGFTRDLVVLSHRIFDHLVLFSTNGDRPRFYRHATNFCVPYLQERLHGMRKGLCALGDVGEKAIAGGGTTSSLTSSL
jgi:hypothetical protein